MSDPVTNVEIEDVLSSIRRLVSDGDKARTRDPAPVEEAAEPAVEAAFDDVETPESKPDKFVLTPAFMVVDNNAADKADDIAVDDASNDDDDDAGWVEETSADPVADPDGDEENSTSDISAAEDHAHDDDTYEDADTDGPLPLTEMVWGSVNDARKAGIAAVPADVDAVETAPHTPDRSQLVATIAELEAAVSNDVQDYEPDGSEDASDMMGETIAWPGAVARRFEDVQDAEETLETPTADSVPDLEVEDAPLAFEHRASAVEPDVATEDAAQEQEQQDVAVQQGAVQEDAAQDEYGDDDLDGLLEAGGVALDEEALRALVSEVVREELTGPMGERITRNVRKLVRREIYRILSSQEFD